MSSKILTIYIISDGTGETADGVVRAVLVQYKQDQVKIVRHQNIRAHRNKCNPC